MKHHSSIALALCVVGAACSHAQSGTDQQQSQTDDEMRKGGTQEGVDQPAAPCHPNPNAEIDVVTLLRRGDVRALPNALKSRLARMAGRPHSAVPTQAYAEADQPSQLFQYYLLDTNNFEPNPFTASIPGVNDKAMKTATGGNCGLPTIGAVRQVLEPKPGLPTDPSDVRAFIDVFTDISVLFVINNESGWYEGWMLHDIVVPEIASACSDGHSSKFGKITQEDAQLLAQMGAGHNVPGAIFTMDGNEVRFPSAADKFPSVQSNVVSLHLSMGTFNALQQSDAHAYWEFNYTTNWIHPLYELPFTGGFPTAIGQAATAFDLGLIGKLSSLVPGSGPLGVQNAPQKYGDNPLLPRDPDRFDAENADAQREFRMRSIPSGLANEIMLDVFVRVASFMPEEKRLDVRLFNAYAIEVAKVDQNGDGVISAVEGDVDAASDGFADNTRLFLPATEYKRFAVTREINDGYLAPRFAPSQRAWVLSGMVTSVANPVPASTGRDADDR